MSDAVVKIVFLVMIFIVLSPEVEEGRDALAPRGERLPDSLTPQPTIPGEAGSLSKTSAFYELAAAPKPDLSTPALGAELKLHGFALIARLTDRACGYLMPPTMSQMNQRIVYIGGGAIALVAVAIIVLWAISSSRAENRAAELVTASADLVRCVAGDSTEFHQVAVERGFHRRLVSELPDVSTVGDCDQALEPLKEKVEAYTSVWSNSWSADGSDGRELGARVDELVGKLSQLQFKTPSDKVLSKPELRHPLRELPTLAFSMYQASTELAAEDGLSADELKASTDARERQARKVPPAAPAAKQMANAAGVVAPGNWEVLPASPMKLTLIAKTNDQHVMMTFSDDGGTTWKSASTADLAAQPKLMVRGIYGPAHSRWLVASYEQAGKRHTAISKVDGAAIPNPWPLPSAPEGWSLAENSDLEVAVLTGDVLVYPVWKVVERTKEEKKEQEKREKEWAENYGAPEVQLEMKLKDARDEFRKAAGIDEDHKRLDGLAYVKFGETETRVRELPDNGLGGLVPGDQALMVLGRGPLPSLELQQTNVPLFEEPLGALITASAPRAMLPDFRGSSWLRCMSADGWNHGITRHGNELLNMRPGVLEMVTMRAQASADSHMGCGQATSVVALALEKDRIFSNVLTVRGGEVEGSKVATTAGTHVSEYNATVATGVVPQAVVVAWVTEGYVQAAASFNWGTEYRAPELIAEAGEDGSTITGLRLVGLGERLLGIFTRQRCSTPQSCQTSFESLVSEDGAKTWKTPG